MTDNSKIRHSRTHTPHSASVFIYFPFPGYLFTFLLIPQEFSAAFSSAIAPLSAPSRTLPAFRFGINLPFFPRLSFFFLANTARVLCDAVMTDNSKIRHSRTHTPHSASVFFTFLSPVILFFLFPLSFRAMRPRSPRLPRCRRQQVCPRAPYSAYPRRRHGLRHSRALRPASQRGGHKPLSAKCSRP